MILVCLETDTSVFTTCLKSLFCGLSYVTSFKPSSRDIKIGMKQTFNRIALLLCYEEQAEYCGSVAHNWVKYKKAAEKHSLLLGEDKLSVKSNLRGPEYRIPDYSGGIIDFWQHVSTFLFYGVNTAQQLSINMFHTEELQIRFLRFWGMIVRHIAPTRRTEVLVDLCL